MSKQHSSKVLALGTQWFLEWVKGKSLRQIGRESGRDRNLVNKYVEKAAATMVENAQQKIMGELFPMALQVLKEYMKLELAKIKAGKEPNWEQINRLMDGLQIYSVAGAAPKKRKMGDDTESEGFTLEAYKATFGRKDPKQIEVVDSPLQLMEGVKDADEV